MKTCVRWVFVVLGIIADGIDIILYLSLFLEKP
jgi:hypothetical protein